MKSFLFLIIFLVFSCSIQSQEFNLIPIQKGDKWGFCNTDKELILDPIYDSVSIFKDRRAIVKIEEKYGLIDERGRFILKPKYSWMGIYFTWPMSVSAKRKSKHLIFDIDGNLIKTKPRFPYICGRGFPRLPEYFHYSIKKDNKVALISYDVDYRQSNLVALSYVRDTSEFIYDGLEALGKTSFVVQKNGKTGIWVPDELGLKIDFSYEEIVVNTGRFQLKNLHKFKLNDKWGLMNCQGAIIIPEKYFSIEYEVSKSKIETLYKVEYKPGVFGFVDMEGKEYF